MRENSIHLICVSINRKWKGKNPNLPDAKLRQWFGLYNSHFHNEIVEMPQFLGEIRKGYGFTTWHRNYRKESNFTLGQHIGIDIDHVSRDELGRIFDNPLTRHAAFAYTTSSHRYDNPRYRIVFALDRVVRDAKQYVLLVRSVLHRYSLADPACKDPCRIFFGSEGCDIEWWGNTLSVDYLQANLVPEYEAEMARINQCRVSLVKNPVQNADQALIFRHLEGKIMAAPDGQKRDVLLRTAVKAGGYVAAGYINGPQVVDFLYKIIQKRSIEDKEIAHNTILHGVEYGISNVGPIYLSNEYTSVSNILDNREENGAMGGFIDDMTEFGL